MIVGAVGALGHHDVGGDARQVRLIGQRQQVEHHLHLIRESIELAHGSIGNLQRAEVLGRGHLHPALDFANAFEIPVEHLLVAAAELALQVLGAGP